MAEETKLDSNNQPVKETKNPPLKVKTMKERLRNNSLDSIYDAPLLTPTRHSQHNIEDLHAVVGNFSLADRDLNKNYLNTMEKAAYDEAMQKHNDQTWVGQAGGFLAQAIVGEIVLGTLEGLGYLADWEQGYNYIKGDHGEFGNAFSNLMQDAKQGVRNLAPIHMDPYKQGVKDFDPASSSWWFSNGVSVVSTASILIPVAGWARGVSLAGKGIRAAALSGKMGRVGGAFGRSAKAFNWVDTLAKTRAGAKLGELGDSMKELSKTVGDGVHKAVVSRHIENMMESSGVYREKFDELVKKGYTEEEAEKRAGAGAAFSYGANWAMLMQDIPQYLALGKMGKISKGVVGGKLAQAQNKAVGEVVESVGKARWKKAFDYTKQMAGEGFEESYQYVIGEEAKYMIDVEAGLVEDSSFMERMEEYGKSGEMWTSAMFGALGGGVFQAAGPHIEKLTNKIGGKKEAQMDEQARRIEAIQKRSAILKKSHETLSRAMETGNDQAVAAAKEQIALEIAFNGIENGNHQMDLDALEQLSKASEEELGALGLDPSFKEQALEYRDKVAEVAAMYEENRKEWHKNSAKTITLAQYNLKELEKKQEQVKKNVEEATSNIPFIKDMSAAGQVMFTQAVQQKAKELYIKQKEHRLATDETLTENQEVDLREDIALMKEALAEEIAEVQESIEGDTLTKKDKEILNPDMGYVNKIAKAQVEADYVDTAIRKNARDLAFAQSKEGQDIFKGKTSLEEVRAKIEDDKVRARKHEELIQSGKILEYEDPNTDEFSEDTAVIVEGTPKEYSKVEDLVDQPVNYKGTVGVLKQDGQRLIVETPTTKHDIGNINDLSKEEAWKIGITQEEGVLLEGGYTYTVRGRQFTNQYSDPLSAISRDKDGNVVTVSLSDQNNKTVTFRGLVAEELAYSILLETAANEEQTDGDLATFIEEQPEVAELSSTTEKPTISDPAEVSGEEDVESVEYDDKGNPEKVVKKKKKKGKKKKEKPTSSIADILDETTQESTTDKTPEEEARFEETVETIARKKVNGQEELTEEEQAFYEENSETVDIYADIIYEQEISAEEEKALGLHEEETSNELRSVSEAAEYEEHETPNNANEHDLRDVRQTSTETVEEQEFDDIAVDHVELTEDFDDQDPSDGSILYKLAWKSSSLRGITNEEREANQELTDYLESQQSLDGVYFIIEIDEDYKIWKNNGKSLRAIKEQWEKGELPTDIGLLPMKAMLYKNGKPVNFNGKDLQMNLHTDKFTRFSGGMQERHVKEVRRVKTKAAQALLEGKRLVMDAGTKTRGNIAVEMDGEQFAKNNPKDSFMNPQNMIWLYGHDGKFMDSDKSIFDDPSIDLLESSANGAIYIAVTTPNGQKFPLRLFSEKLSNGEANIIMRVMEGLVVGNNYNMPLDESFIDWLKKLKDPRVAGLFDYLPTLTSGMTYGELLDHLVYNGFEKTKGTDTSQLWVNPASSKGQASIKVGMNSYTAEDMKNPSTQKAIIKHLMENRNRQVDARMLNNEGYKNYLMDTGALTTNAQRNKRKNPFVQPSVTYTNERVETTGKITTKVKEETEASKVNVEARRAEIEKRRQGELSNTFSKKADVEINISHSSKTAPNGKTYQKINLMIGNYDISNNADVAKIIKVLLNYTKNLDKKDGFQISGNFLRPIEESQVWYPLGRVKDFLEERYGITKEQLDKDINPLLNKNSLTKKEINAKYDAELAALKSQSNTEVNEELETATKEVLQEVTEAPSSSSPQQTTGQLDMFESAEKARPDIPEANQKELDETGYTQFLDENGEVVEIADTTKQKEATEAEPITTIEPPSKEVVSDKEWNNFVDTGSLLTSAPLESIIKKLKAGENLSERELAIYTSEAETIESRLTEDAKASSAPAVEKPSDEEADDVGFVNPFKATKNEETSNQFYVDNEAEHLKTLLPEEIAIKLQDDYVHIISQGWAAVGMFKNGAIELSRKGGQGTGYHEAFHAVYRTMTTAQERMELLHEAVRIFAIPSEQDIATLRDHHPTLSENAILELYYEEQLADEFAEYMYDKGAFAKQPHPKGIKGFFSRLFEWMGIFQNRSKAEKMFSRIKRGKYRNRPVNITRGFAYKAHKDYSREDTREITKALSAMGLGTATYVEDLAKDVDVKGNIDKSLRLYIHAASEASAKAKLAGHTNIAEDRAQTAIKLQEIYDEIYVEGNEFFLDKVDAYLSADPFGLTSKDAKRNQEDPEENEDADGNMIDLKSSYERSGKFSTTADIKTLIALTDMVDGNGQKDMSGFLKLPKKVNFSATWNKLEIHLAGVTAKSNGDTFQAQMDKLRYLAKYHPEYAVIADKLEAADEDIQTQFHRTFARMRGDYVSTLISGDKDAGNLLYKMQSNDNFSKSAQIVDDWTADFILNMRENTDKGTIFSPEKKSTLTTAVNLAARAVRTYQEADSSTVESVRNSLPERRQEAITGIMEALSQMGVRMTRLAIEKTIDEQGKGSERANFGEFGKKLRTVEREIFKRDGALNEKTVPLAGESFIQELAGFQAEFAKVVGENMVFVGGGNKAWLYQNNNFVSSTINRIKAGDLDYIKRIAATPFGSNSIWAKQILEDPSVASKLSVKMYGNYVIEGEGDKGDKASNLKPTDQFNDVLNKYLQSTLNQERHGLYVGLAEADKGQQQYIGGPKAIASNVYLEGKNIKIAGKVADAPIIKALAGYLADEMNRAAAAHEAVNGVGEAAWDTNQLLSGYHYTWAKDKKTGKKTRVAGNSQLSYLFPSLNERDDNGVSKMEKMGLAVGDIPMKVTKDAILGNPKLVAFIKDSFIAMVRADLKRAMDNNVIMVEGGKVKNRTITTEVINNPQKAGLIGDESSVIVGAIAHFTANSIVSNVEMTKLFTGDPALYARKGDGFGDFRKRVPAITASGIDARIFRDKDGNWVVPPTYASAVIDNIEDIPSITLLDKTHLALVETATGIPLEQLETLFKPYREVNVTDAQAWITFPAYRTRMKAFGKWSPKHEAAYNRISAGEVLPSDLKLMAMPLKTVHAGHEQAHRGGLFTMQYNKQSEAPLIPGIHDQTPLKGLMFAMERDAIDHVIVQDGKKAGQSGSVKVHDANGAIIAVPDLNPLELDMKNLKLQQDLSSKGTKPTKVGTQATKNVMAVVKPERMYMDDKTGVQLLEDYNQTISKLSNIGLEEYLKEIGYRMNETTGKRELNEEKFRAALAREFEGEVSENITDQLAAGIPLDGITINRRIQYKVNAMIKKKVVELKQLGGAFVQMSDFGLMGAEYQMTDQIKNGIRWLKSDNADLQPMRLEKRPDGQIVTKAAQVLISHSMLEKVLNGHLEEGKTIYDLTHAELNEMIDKESLKGLMYRIPNQGPPSNDAFEVAGILPPHAGDTIVAFKEITTKTGSDFDIDKAFIVLPNFEFSNGKVRAISIHQDSKKGLENRRLDLMRQMLLHPEAYAQVMAPLDTPWLKDFIVGDKKKGIDGIFPEGNEIRDLEFFSGSHQLDTKALFDSAKSLVGVIANHMAHHSIAVHADMFYSGVNLGVGKTVTSADGKEHSLVSVATDVDGYAVEETLGAYMNAIVDATKDPYIARANINQVTASTAFMLARSGASREWISAFIGQPIIREYVELMNTTEGRLAPRVLIDGKQVNALEQILHKYQNVIGKVSEEEFRTKFPQLGRTNGKINTTTEQLIKGITNPDTSDQFISNQMHVLAQFIKWQSNATGNLKPLIAASKADVNGAGKSIISTRLLKTEMGGLIGSRAIGNLEKFLGYELVETHDGVTYFDEEKTKPVYSTTVKWKNEMMLGTYYNNTVETLLEVVGPLFFAENEGVRSLVDEFVTVQGVRLTEENMEFIIQQAFAAMNSGENSPYHASEEDLRRYLYGSPQLHGAPVRENFSIGDRVKKAQEDPLLAENAFIKNLAIKPGAAALPWLSPKALDVDAKNELYLAWAEIKDYAADPNLYKDLIKMAYYTSGLGPGFGTFHEHIPSQFLQEEGYAGFYGEMSESINSRNSLGGLVEKISKHQWKNSKIVPPISKKQVNQIKFKDVGLSLREGFAADTRKVPALSNTSIIYPVKKFVKIGFYNEKQDSYTWVLYKHAGFLEDGTAAYFATNKQGFKGQGLNFYEYNVEDGSVFAENTVTLSPQMAAIRDFVQENPGWGDRGTQEDVALEDISQKDKDDAAQDNLFCGGQD